MLIRSTFSLSVSETTALPRSYNLELVKLLHQELGLEIGGDKIPSLSYSGICGLYATDANFFIFQPNSFYQLSLCGLEEKTSEAILDLNLPDTLEFLGAKFNVINRSYTVTSYEELYTTLVADEPEPVRQFEIQFTTPTTFSQQGTTLPLPVPHLMFRSWLERWNNFSPVYLGGNELVAYLSKTIFLKHHNILTRSVQLQKGYINGFVGDVTLQIFNQADYLIANVADLLIQYAQFAGTGMKTRLGMGQTSFLNFN
jgi:CRISPR-associated endoribonuclease Cas6